NTVIGYHKRQFVAREIAGNRFTRGAEPDDQAGVRSGVRHVGNLRWPAVRTGGCTVFAAHGKGQRRHAPRLAQQTESPGKCCDFHQRTLSVERPIRTRITVTIQKRTMILGSAQPLSSKWWCRGAILNIRLPVSL